VERSLHGVRYDQRGFGKTTCEDRPFSNRDDIRLLLDHLGVERASVVGLSRGGQIATDFTIEHRTSKRAGRRRIRASAATRCPTTTASTGEIRPARDREAVAELVEKETQIWTDGVGQPPTRVDPSCVADGGVEPRELSRRATCFAGPAAHSAPR
jgi:pimeloyl-ACP methyl ester carboxylesterase